MEVQFSYNTSDERQIFKTLKEGITLEGNLRDDSSIVNPVIMFKSDEVMKFNFCYIPKWQRYYFVRDIKSYRNDLYIVTMECDVLMSFKNDIANFQVIVDKQTLASNGDEYIDDGSLVVDNIMFNRVYNFARGFNNSPEYILITAG